MSYTASVHADVDKVLIDRETIAARIQELGETIDRDLKELDHGEEVVLVPILTGSIIFVADLMRQLSRKLCNLAR